MEKAPQSQPKRHQEKTGYRERALLFVNLIENKLTEYLDDLKSHVVQASGNLGASLIVFIARSVSWLVATDGDRRNWFMVLIKAIIGLPLIIAFGGTLLLLILAVGTLASILGFRNIADYSLKEQSAAWLFFFLFLVIAPFYFSEYALHRVTLIAVYSIGVIGFNLLFGQCGIVSMGMGGFLLTSSFFSAWLANGTFGFQLPLPLAILCAAILNAFVGAIFGIPALRVKDSYLVVVSLVITLVVPKILRSPHLAEISGVRATGLGLDSVAIPKFLNFLPSHVFIYLMIMIPALVLVFIAYNLIHHSQIGRAFRTIRCDNEVSQIMGIPVVRYKLMAFVLSAVYAGFAGGLMAMVTLFVSVDAYSTSTSVDFLVASVLGGPGSILGAIFGGTFLTYEPEITEWASHLIPGGKYLAKVTYGLLVIIVIFFFPYGIMGSITAKIKGFFLGRPRRGGSQYQPPPDYDLLSERKKYFPPK